MKPRLKPTQGGGIRVVQKGLNPWGEASARQFIQEHYGSLAEFAAHYHFPYNAVCIALQTSYRPDKMSGQVEAVRMVLGLPSQPGTHARSLDSREQQERRV